MLVWAVDTDLIFSYVSRLIFGLIQCVVDKAPWYSNRTTAQGRRDCLIFDIWSSYVLRIVFKYLSRCLSYSGREWGMICSPQCSEGKSVLTDWQSIGRFKNNGLEKTKNKMSDVWDTKGKTISFLIFIFPYNLKQLRWLSLLWTEKYPSHCSLYPRTLYSMSAVFNISKASYLKDMGMVGRTSAWVMVRRKPI